MIDNIESTMKMGIYPRYPIFKFNVLLFVLINCKKGDKKIEKHKVYIANCKLYSPKTCGVKFNAIIFPNKSITSADAI